MVEHINLPATYRHEAGYGDRARENRQIEELNQDKVRFFINISNEFRTPLALIIGKIESLLRSPQLPHSLLNKVNGAYTNCVLMRDMMAELLDFRRYERGAMKIKVGEHNVVKFLSDIYALFRDYAADKGIRFRFNRSNESIMLWYDQAQLRKVVNNLLSNAFKHTKSDGEVTLSVRKGDGVVVIEVSDTGCGISSKDIDKIFNRFYQGSIGSEGDWQGIGVGLALSKGIVELHHGKIEVFSTPVNLLLLLSRSLRAEATSAMRKSPRPEIIVRHSNITNSISVPPSHRMPDRQNLQIAAANRKT